MSIVLAALAALYLLPTLVTDWLTIMIYWLIDCTGFRAFQTKPNYVFKTHGGGAHIEVDNVAFRVGRHGGGLVAIGDIGDDGGGHKVAEEIANMVIYMEDTGGQT